MKPCDRYIGGIIYITKSQYVELVNWCYSTLNIKSYGSIGCTLFMQKSNIKDPKVLDIAEKVVGVVQVDDSFLEPVHNKQDFRETREYQYVNYTL